MSERSLLCSQANVGWLEGPGDSTACREPTSRKPRTAAEAWWRGVPGRIALTWPPEGLVRAQDREGRGASASGRRASRWPAVLRGGGRRGALLADRARVGRSARGLSGQACEDAPERLVAHFDDKLTSRSTEGGPTPWVDSPSRVLLLRVHHGLGTATYGLVHLVVVDDDVGTITCRMPDPDAERVLALRSLPSPAQIMQSNGSEPERALR